MKWSAAFSFIACLAFVSAQSVTQETPKASPHTETTASQSTTHELPSPSPKTTESPSTTHESPNTTTPHLSTTVPPPPPTPAPKKGPSVNSYNVTEPGTNHTCILVKAALQLKVNYMTKNDQVKEALLPLDNETVVDHTHSSCNSPGGEQTLALQFGRNDSLKLSFAKNGTVYLHAVNVQYTVDPVNFPDAAKPGEVVTVLNNTFALYSVPEDRSYHCGVDQPIYLGNNVTLDVVSVQLQAFINSTTEKPAQFGTAVECSAGDISNIVPIAVGAALAALVIIVLIAYLIGRSKSRQKGYQSV